MRFIIMHKTNAAWEAGAIPSPELIAHVGALLGELARAGRLHSGEGLRPSSTGARIRLAGGTRTLVQGPFAPGNELPHAFSIVRASSLDAAIDWASQHVGAADGEEIDIRPVTEPWDIGMQPSPPVVETRRFMVMRKATPATEAGDPSAVGRRRAVSEIIAASPVTHIVTETMRPSRRGRRYRNSRDGITVYDGPFIESKELLAGYVILTAESLDDVDCWARQYLAVVGTDEVDVRELVDD
jgi:hypothetical protein